MKWIKLILYIAIITLVIFQFKGLEDYLLGTSVSWSFSKVAPYLTLLLGGLLIALFFRKNTRMPKTLKTVLFWIILIIPFVIGFILNPIYQGDFGKKGKEITQQNNLIDFLNADLLVIAIPGCPFCHQSITSLKLLKKRNPNLRIRMVICDSEEKELMPYIEAIDGAFDLQLASSGDSLARVAGYSFPAFILVKNDVPTEKWSNDQFGVGAKDVIEKYFKR